MTSRIARSCAVALTWLLFAHAAGEPLAAVPKLTQRVTDLTATLSPATVSTLEQRLTEFQQRKGAQVSVLLVPTTAPEDIESYSLRVVEQWKLGRKKVDDGALLLIAVQDHRMRIEVGYGLEGALPDAIAKRIVSDTVAPLFKAGKYDTGVTAGVEAILHVIEGETLPAATNTDDASSRRRGGGGIVPALLVAFVVGRIFGAFGKSTPTKVGAASIGGLLTAGIASAVTATIGLGLLAGLAAFVIALLGIGGGRWISGGRGFGGFGGGGFGGGGFGGGGGFSGGGGSFGGGGASGSW